MLLLENTIRDYAWGEIDGISAVVGSHPSGGPEAELWVGTHPGAPSVVVGDPEGRTLAEVIAADPERWLGPELAAAGATALPFLLKVLAIGAPLSLQAHPSAEQAQAGFAREEAAGIPVGATERNYRDAGSKPEALVALDITWALCGFRKPLEAANLLAGLAIEAFDPLVAVLAEVREDSVRTVVEWLLRLDEQSRTSVAEAVASAVARVRGDDLDDPRVWVRRLTEVYPGDPTAIAPLLLKVVRLDPGDAIHLPAGNLHAYLQGTGVEIMAASDNVLRGGLTPKHVDVDELLSVVDFGSGVTPKPNNTDRSDGISTYDADEEAFALAVTYPAGATVQVTPTGPSLLLATHGAVTVSGPSGAVVLEGGRAAFVAPHSGAYGVSGPGRLWWATTGAGLPR